MIVGETRTLRHKETGESAWTVSANSIAITRPDDCADTSPPSITNALDPSDPLSYIFSGQYTPVSGGRYIMSWAITPSNLDVLYRPVRYYAYWTDVPGIVRQKLQNDPDDVPDYEIDREFVSIARELQDYFTALGAYSALTLEDAERFDEGVAILAVSYTHLTLPTILRV